MRKNVSPHQSDKIIDRESDYTSDMINHQNKRSSVNKYRSIVKNKSHLPVCEQLKSVMEAGMSKSKLIQVLDLTEADVNNLIGGMTYPYLIKAWNRIMFEPDHFTENKLTMEDRRRLNLREEYQERLGKLHGNK